MTTTIKSISIAHFCDEGTTVEVETNGETFYVQTTDGEYRSSLGCWILTSYSDGDINTDDYPNVDFNVVIKAAEDFISAQFEEIDSGHQTKFGETILLLKSQKGVQVVLKNTNYINADSSTYSIKYNTIESFDERLFEDEDEAIEAILKTLLTTFAQNTEL